MGGPKTAAINKVERRNRMRRSLDDVGRQVDQILRLRVALPTMIHADVAPLGMYFGADQTYGEHREATRTLEQGLRLMRQCNDWGRGLFHLTILSVLMPNPRPGGSVS